MINSQNIIAFIQFLYQERLRESAPQDLLDSWSGLSDEEVKTYLDQLFHSWNLSEQEIESYKNAFLYPGLVDEKKAELQVENKSQEKSTYSDVSYPENKKGSGTTKKIGITILVLFLLQLYPAIRFYQYKSLKYVYVTTDNVVIRNHKGENIGRMDIFSQNNSVSFLRTTGKKTYPIQIKDKVYDCRRVLLESSKFSDFFLNKKKAFAFVNENYLVDSKDEFLLYRSVFKAVNNNKNENSTLTSAYRKVIVGSLRRESNLRDLYILTSCDNGNKEYSNIVKHQVNENVYQVVAQLSNNRYYVFSGNIKTGKYDMPFLLNYKILGEESYSADLDEHLLFRKMGDTYFLYNCRRTPREYYLVVDEQNKIFYARYSFDF